MSWEVLSLIAINTVRILSLYLLWKALQECKTPRPWCPQWQLFWRTRTLKRRKFTVLLRMQYSAFPQHTNSLLHTDERLRNKPKSCVQWDYTKIFPKWGRSANAKCCTWGRKTPCNRTGWGQRFAVWGAPAPNRAWFSSRASQGGRLHCSAWRREEGDPTAVLSCLKEGVRTSDSVQTLLAGERANSNRQVAERWVTVRYHKNRNMGCAERSKQPLETFKKIRKVTNTCSILVLLW